MKKILITGGAGFIGCNLAKFLADKSRQVVIFDNLSRRGTDVNLEWLLGHSKAMQFFKGDIRSNSDLDSCFLDYGPFHEIYHLAGQVAVTSSVVNPRQDFEINAGGTFNLLEAVRRYNPEAILLYSSTNKVYGKTQKLEIVEHNNRYMYRDFPKGVSEDIALDFHSPYGCSKGAADQYVLDYARIYGLKTIVLRQSCIYGYRQFGIEDQGWVAWFIIAAMFDKTITIFGDGKQVRDVLFIDDLLNAFELVVDNIHNTSGKAYNIGGCYYNISLLELLHHLEGYFKKRIDYVFSDWRSGDQRVFIADISKAGADFGWKPVVDVETGLDKLAKWLLLHKGVFAKVGII